MPRFFLATRGRGFTGRRLVIKIPHQPQAISIPGSNWADSVLSAHSSRVRASPACLSIGHSSIDFENHEPCNWAQMKLDRAVLQMNLNRRRLSASMGVVFPWTVDLRYAASSMLRRALRMPAEDDFRVVK